MIEFDCLKDSLKEKYKAVAIILEELDFYKLDDFMFTKLQKLDNPNIVYTVKVIIKDHKRLSININSLDNDLKNDLCISVYDKVRIDDFIESRDKAKHILDLYIEKIIANWG